MACGSSTRMSKDETQHDREQVGMPPARGSSPQNLKLQLFKLPVSAAALSLTRSLHVPLATLVEASTV